MITKVSSTAPSNQKLEKIFPTLVNDFKQIAGNFTELVKLRKEENITVLREKYRIREIAYKSRFATKVEKKYESKPLAEHASGFLSLLKGIGGALGTAFLILGAAGVARMILSSSAGSYMGKFIALAFEAVLDLFKKTINFLSDILKDNRIKDAFIKAFNSLFQSIGILLSKSFDIVKSLFNDTEIRSALIKTIIALFTAIVFAIQASHAVIKKLLDDDIGTIRTNLIELFSKIVDVFVNVLSVAGNLFQTLMQNDEFLQGLKNIFTSLVNLVIEAFKYDYKNPKTGERVNILQEVGIIIGEMALLFAASAALRRKFLIAGAAIDKHGLGGVNLPNVEEEERKKRGVGRAAAAAGVNKGTKQIIKKVSPERLAKIKEAQLTKATWFEKFKLAVQRNLSKVSKLVDAFRYSKLGSTKIVNLVYTVIYRVSKKFSESAIKRALVALAAGVTTAIYGGPLGWIVLALDFWLYYELIMLIIDNVDPIVEAIKDAEEGLEKVFRSQNFPLQTFSGMEGAPIPTFTGMQGSPGSAFTEMENVFTPTFTGMQGTDTAASTTPTQSSEKSGVIYTVGDSHSNGISNYGKRKGFIAKGKDGSLSTAKMHLNAIDSIPEGSNVVISLGANDLASGRTISSIVTSVTSVIAAAQQRGLNVTYLLPTLTASNKPYDPRRVELREALKQAVKVPIVDLGQASTSDKLGVHLDSAGYSQIAGKVSQVFKSSTSSSTTISPVNLPKENLDNVPQNLQNFVQNSSDTLTNVVKDLAKTNQVNSETEKKTTLAGILISQLSSQLKALDEMTGGKLGVSSMEMTEALRYLEDEFNQGTTIFDLSSKAAVHKTETNVNTPPNIQKTNQNILNAILKRQYT